MDLKIDQQCGFLLLPNFCFYFHEDSHYSCCPRASITTYAIVKLIVWILDAKKADPVREQNHEGSADKCRHGLAAVRQLVADDKIKSNTMYIICIIYTMCVYTRQGFVP